jgi:hypothetical protein
MEASYQLESTSQQAVTDESVVNQQQQGGRKEEFACLYTKHKTQKRKVWNDGRLVLRFRSAVLYDVNPAPGSSDPALDQCELTNEQKQALLENRETRLESEQFLIEVEGTWRKPAYTSMSKASAPKVSSSMQKLLSRKFQKPQAYIPPHPTNRPNCLHAILGKRKRPLQPGELVRVHHGGAPSPQGLSMGGGPPAGTLNHHRSGQFPQRGNMIIQHGNRNDSQINNCTFSNDNHARQEGCFGQSAPPQLQPMQNATQNSISLDSIRGQSQPDSFVLQTPGTDHEPPSANAAPDPFVLQTFGRIDAGRQDVDARPDQFALQPMNATVNPNHTSQQEQPGGQQQASNNRTSDFVSNGFNATSFYGLDDEEEEEKQDFSRGNHPAHSNSNPSAFSIESGNPFNPPVRTPNPTTGSSASDNSNNKTVSDTALLALFGAAAPADTEMTQEPAVHAPTNGNADLQDSEPVQPPAAETNAPARTVSTTDFVLPNQSSSEDESGNEGS